MISLVFLLLYQSEAEQFVTDLMTEEENVTSVADYPPDERRSLDTFATDRFARDEDVLEKSYLDDEISLRSEESGTEKGSRQNSLSTTITTPTKAGRASSSHLTSVDNTPEEETKEVTTRRSSRRR